MRILIADDDESVRVGLRARLKAWGFETVECRDGGEALEALVAPDAPQLAILDWMMPVLDGPEVCRELRARGSRAYVLLFSARGASSDVVTTLAAGADDHIAKGIPPNELRARVQAGVRIVTLQNQIASQMGELRVLFDRNPCPMWVVDASTAAILDVNDAACSQYGYTRDEFLRLNVSDLRVAGTGTRNAAIGRTVTLPARGVSRIERHRGRRGAEIDVEVTDHALEFGGRQARLVLAQDVTHRVLAERLAMLQHAVTRILSEAGSVADAKPRLLATMCEGLGADIAELWEVEPAIGLLRGGDVWAPPGIDVVEFRRESLRCVQRPGSSLAGTVWETKRPIWAPSLQAPGVRERLSAAESLGLRSSLAFPILADETVLGVVQLYARNGGEPHPDCLGVLVSLGNQIGQFIVREDSELMHRETHVRLAALVADSPLAIMVFDREGYVQMWNPAAERIFGWSSAEALGRPNPIVPPDKAQESLQFRTSVIKGERITGVQVQRQTKDGRLIDVSLSTAPIRDEHGVVTSVMSIIQDISEEKAAERELLEAHDETERLLSAIASVLIGIRADGRISRWNGAAKRTFKRHAAEVFGLTLRESGIAWDHEALEEAMTVCRRLREPVALNDFCYTIDDRERYLNLVLTPVTAGREAGSFVLLASDVTDYRVLQSQLAQAQKLEAIGQLAAGIAHEINTPMQYVGDNVRFLRDGWSGVSEVLLQAARVEAERTAGMEVETLLGRLSSAVAAADLDYLVTEIPAAIEQTLEGVDRVTEIVKGMKEFSHPGVQQKTAVDVNHAIETTLSVARHEWKYVCEVVTELAPALPLVPCLPGEINQVILNLLVNAAHAIADAMPDGGKGRITIQTQHVAGDVEIRVSDTGTGIPEAIRGRIFDPFFTTKDVGRGTGQGLALAHNVVVNKHRGRIWFETEVGRGTTFHVRLPLQDSTVQIHDAAHSLR